MNSNPLSIVLNEMDGSLHGAMIPQFASDSAVDVRQRSPRPAHLRGLLPLEAVIQLDLRLGMGPSVPCRAARDTRKGEDQGISTHLCWT